MRVTLANTGHPAVLSSHLPIRKDTTLFFKWSFPWIKGSWVNISTFKAQVRGEVKSQRPRSGRLPWGSRHKAEVQGKGHSTKLYSGLHHLVPSLYLFISLIIKIWPSSVIPALCSLSLLGTHTCHFCKCGPGAGSRPQPKAHLFLLWWSAGLFDQWFQVWEQMYPSSHQWLRTPEVDSSACSLRWHAWPTRPP